MNYPETAEFTEIRVYADYKQCIDVGKYYNTNKYYHNGICDATTHCKINTENYTLEFVSSSFSICFSIQFNHKDKVSIRFFDTFQSITIETNPILFDPDYCEFEYCYISLDPNKTYNLLGSLITCTKISGKPPATIIESLPKVEISEIIEFLDLINTFNHINMTQFDKLLKIINQTDTLNWYVICNYFIDRSHKLHLPSIII